MRPLTILLGIVMGSTVSLAVGLLGTWIVILFLPKDAERFAPEHAALLHAIAIFVALAAASAFSFYGDLRSRAWRLPAHAVSLLLLATTIWVYWPT
jgi:ABC-type antimicrobial peptide transport system permease subunit